MFLVTVGLVSERAYRTTTDLHLLGRWVNRIFSQPIAGRLNESGERKENSTSAIQAMNLRGLKPTLREHA